MNYTIETFPFSVAFVGVALGYALCWLRHCRVRLGKQIERMDAHQRAMKAHKQRSA